MSAFLLATGLAALFVLGSAFALRPSPRQRQLANLRQAAVGAGLRVSVRPGETLVDYLLPWRIVDLDGTRVPDLVAAREPAGPWRIEVRRGPAPQALQSLLEALPPSVTRIVVGAEGLSARWPEHGSDAAVVAIADALARLRELCRPSA